MNNSKVGWCLSSPFFVGGIGLLGYNGCNCFKGVEFYKRGDHLRSKFNYRPEFIYLRQQIYEAADLFYMRKDQRRYWREDPSVCGTEGMCVMNEKVLCGGKKLCSS